MRLYIVFDGPPSPEGPRFIEVENEVGQSVNAAEGEQEWKEDTHENKGYWRLGPFYTNEGGQS